MFTLNERIGPSRIDENGRLKLSAALDLLQDCSLLWMTSEPTFYAYLKDNGLGMFLVSRQMDILRLPAFGDSVAVRTSVYDCRSFYGYRNTAIYGEDGSPCVLTWSIGAFVDMATGKIVRLPPEVIESVAFDRKIDMEYLDKKIKVPPVSGRNLSPVPVRRCDIDFYGHMNNAKYVEAAMELLPEGYAPRRLRIEYKAPARQGELLHPRVIETEDGNYIVILADAQGNPYAVMEFTS